MPRPAIDVLRSAHLRSIDLDPVVVSFVRKIEVKVGSRKTYVDQPVGPLRVRIFQDRYQSELTTTGTVGSVDIGRRWGLLAPHDADLKADQPTPDEFVVAGVGRFRLRDIIPHRYKGETWGIEADLERRA